MNSYTEGANLAILQPNVLCGVLCKFFSLLCVKFAHLLSQSTNAIVSCLSCVIGRSQGPCTLHSAPIGPVLTIHCSLTSWWKCQQTSVDFSAALYALQITMLLKI